MHILTTKNGRQNRLQLIKYCGFSSVVQTNNYNFVFYNSNNTTDYTKYARRLVENCNIQKHFI